MNIVKSALPTSEPKLILFDMDGIMVDSMPTHTWSWKKVCDEYGIESSRDEFYLYEGMRGVDTIKELYHRTYGKYPSEELTNEIYNLKTEYFRKLSKSYIKRIPGTLKLIKYLKEERGHEIAVVTGSTKYNAYDRINQLYGSLIPKNLIITAEHVLKGKPDPEPYLKGMQLFDRGPEETLVIENAPKGVRSGAQSGAFTVAITTGPIASHILREEGAHLVFPDMKSLHVWWKNLYQ